MTDDALAARATRIGTLADPIRQRLYRFIARQPEPVSREQAADALEVPRHTARFHLERLVEAGLLATEFRRLSGRSGPGAGRPAKLYVRAQGEVNVSIPSRRYDLAGEVLADAVERALGGVEMPRALSDAAKAAAVAVADAIAPEQGPSGFQTALLRLGYEPRAEAATTVLTNCPFQRLAAGHEELVCGVNEEFLIALADQVDCDRPVTRRPRSGGGCCLQVGPRAT
ncbi:helix-turn-helix transcriptional regulator [Nocardioides limicola]|uniref:helix-turn-helix transcriptional regulator n=1 Tax=Nocardioides limicola TaxID=2803368 RepID=UPI00193BF3E5|nr:helix-turn-helix domain-containing protein [Nocardioides sp. DJM-14]